MKISAIKRASLILFACSCLIVAYRRPSYVTKEQTEQVQQDASRNGGDGEEEEEEEEKRIIFANQIRPFEPQLRLTNQQLEQLSKSHKYDTPNRLLGLRNATFLIEPKSRQVECSTGGLTLLIVVNSKWSNAARRRRIRSTWLNLVQLKDQLCDSSATPKAARSSGAVSKVEFLFALGKPKHEANVSSNLPETRFDPIRMEADKMSDLLVMNLHESYKSMTLKHLMIFKWILKWARQNDRNLNETLILKCDDDARVELGALIELYHETRGQIRQVKYGKYEEHDTSNWLMCAAFPPNSLVLREPTLKWGLSRREFHYDTFPAYCSGLAYLAPIKLVERLYLLGHQLQWDPRARHYERPLWIDDAYITGILAASLADGLNYIKLNGQFCYTRAQQDQRARLNWPCLVSELHEIG